MIVLLIAAAWLLIGFGVWLTAIAYEADSRRFEGYLLLPVVMITWPYLLWSVWEPGES